MFLFLFLSLLTSISLEEKPDSVLVMEYCDLSYHYLLENQDSAIYYGEKAVALAKEIGYDKGLAQAYNDYGLVYYYQSDYPKALELWESALKMRLRLQDSLGVAALHVKIGALQFQTGHLKNSLESQLAALAVYERVQHKEGVAKSLNNIASVYQHQNLYDEALEYLWKAIEIKKEIEDHYEVGGSLMNVGGIYYQKGDLYAAKNTFAEAIAIMENYGFENSVYNGAAQNDLAQVYIDLGDLDSAQYCANKALNIRKSKGDQQGIISAQNRIGLIELKKGHHSSAENTLRETASMANEKGLLKEERDSYEYLTELYRTTKDFRQALAHSDRYHLLQDSLLNESTQQTIAELQTKYETDKKEQQIAIQQSEIAEQKAQNQRNVAVIIGLVFIVLLLVAITMLMRSRARKKQALIRQEAEIKIREMQIEAALNSQEDERKRFARDLHDGFGQMISVLNLNLRSLEKDGEDRESIFENSARILDDMYKELKGICFNLMPETLIKQGVIDAIKEFAFRINQASKVFVEIDTFGIDERLSDVQEISLYRITQEWVNNILKYSNADKITISLTKDDEELTLLIEDNGSGFDKGLLVQGKGNGWKNLNSRTNLIKGELELDTTPGSRGNTLIVNAPVPVDAKENRAEIPA